MAIGDDFTIDYVNRRIYHSSGTTVYTVNELYSWLMDVFDELDQMDDTVPMSAQTPTEYTLINGWFIDDAGTHYSTIKYLKGGAIKTSGWKHPDNPQGIRILTFQQSGYVNCVPSDMGKTVVGGTTGHTGVLLAYDNTRRKWWIRCNSASDTFNQSETITISGGTGQGTTTGASSTGETLWANVYTLGTIETNPYGQIYIFQAGERIEEWSNLSNWDRGHIDVLIKVKECDQLIDNGKVTVYLRQSGDLFDHFEIDLSAGGRNAVPLSTSDDLNEDTGEYYLLYDNETSPFTTTPQIIIGQTSGATAELQSVQDWGTTGLLVLRGVRGTFQDNETIVGSVNGQAQVNGTLGDTFLKYKNETGAFTVGDILTGGTSGAKRIIRGIQDDGTTGKLVLQVNNLATGSNRVAYYKPFQDGETITDEHSGSATADGSSTTLVSGWTDITVAFVNGTVSVGPINGTFIPGERVTYTGGEAILLKAVSGTLTLGNVTNTSLNGKTITGDLSGATCTATSDLNVSHTMLKAFPQQDAYPYDVIINGGDIYYQGRTMSQIYEYLKFITQDGSTFKMYTVTTGGQIQVLDGQEYITAYPGYSPTKQAPFGTFAGGKFFGAQGVWVEGMASGQSYQFTDSNGNIRQPYMTVIIKVTSLVPGDRCVVFRTTNGEIDKAMYTSHVSENTQGHDYFVVQENIAADTPSSGVIRIVDTSTKTEYRHTYTSWEGKTFYGLSPVLQTNFDGTDKAYVPFIDAEATSSTLEKEVIYVTDRPVLVRVRKKGIIPFETPGTVTTAGLTVSAIRTTDGIVT